MARQGRNLAEGGARSNLYDDITNKIIAELEQGRLPWVQPWGASPDTAPLGLPRNASTGRSYSGINILILWGAVIQHSFPGQAWLTFRQALSLAGVSGRVSAAPPLSMQIVSPPRTKSAVPAREVRMLMPFRS